MTTSRRIPKAPRIPKSRRVDVTRAEFDRVIDLLNERGLILNDLRHNLEVQFKRIAAMQAEIDLLRAPGRLPDRKTPGRSRDS